MVYDLNNLNMVYAYDVQVHKVHKQDKKCNMNTDKYRAVTLLYKGVV